MAIRLIKKNEYDIIKNDPVRPHISLQQRTESGNEIYVMENNNVIDAVLCVSYTNKIPGDEEDLKLFSVSQRVSDIAVFYTVWSNKRGMGRKMVLDSIKILQKKKPYIKRFVTLSPINQMASDFHTKNGAKLLGIKKGYIDNNKEVKGCQNFEYIVNNSDLEPERYYDWMLWKLKQVFKRDRYFNG